MIYLKSENEIQIMREGGRILATALKKAAKAVKAGVTTLKIDELVEKFITDKDAVPAFKGYQGFPASVCISINSEVVHGLPSADRKFEEGDIVGLDAGVLYKGLYTDAAVTVGIGKISSEAAKLIDVTKKSLELGISQVKEGNKLGDVGSVIQDYAEANGFSVVRDLVGHGVGKKLHEDPQIPNFGKPGTGVILKKGMTLAIEPMLNVGTHHVKVATDGWTFVTSDQSLSAHFEHTVVVTEKGCEVLTK